MKRKQLITVLIEDAYTSLRPSDLKELIAYNLDDVAVTYILSRLHKKKEISMGTILNYFAPKSKNEIADMYTKIGRFAIHRDDNRLDEMEDKA